MKLVILRRNPIEPVMSRDDRHESTRSLLNRPFILVALGFGLGYLARFLLGPPAVESEGLNRRFERSMPATKPEIDLPLDRESAT